MEPIKNIKKNKNYCHDCKKEIEIKDEEVKNGFLLTYKDERETFTVFKCKECFEANPSLTDYKKCEVYSRVVGYIRPVQQWNTGKQQEFKDRKKFKIKD